MPNAADLCSVLNLCGWHVETCRRDVAMMVPDYGGLLTGHTYSAIVLPLSGCVLHPPAAVWHITHPLLSCKNLPPPPAFLCSHDC